MTPAAINTTFVDPRPRLLQVINVLKQRYDNCDLGGAEKISTYHFTKRGFYLDIYNRRHLKWAISVILTLSGHDDDPPQAVYYHLRRFLNRTSLYGSFSWREVTYKPFDLAIGRRYNS